MSDHSENNAPTPQPQEDKIGDILRKERLTRRITIETIAKDLKLNVGYIKALESNKYEDLPAAPYVRVYLRSIAHYLMLDPDEVIKRYQKERGLDTSNHQEEQSNKLRVNLQETSKPAPLGKIVIIAAIVGLAILGVVANKAMQGQPAGEPEAPASQPAADTAQESIVPTDTLSDSAAAAADDTLLDSAAQGKPATVVAPADSLRLVIQATRDSVWVHTFADGASTKAYIRARRSKTIKARDSINVHVGVNQYLKYTLNSKPTKIAGSGVVVFKVDHSGVKPMTSSEWKTVFGDRL